MARKAISRREHVTIRAIAKATVEILGECLRLMAKTQIAVPSVTELIQPTESRVSQVTGPALRRTGNAGRRMHPRKIIGRGGRLRGGSRQCGHHHAAARQRRNAGRNNAFLCTDLAFSPAPASSVCGQRRRTGMARRRDHRALVPRRTRQPTFKCRSGGVARTRNRARSPCLYAADEAIHRRSSHSGAAALCATTGPVATSRD